MKVKAAVMRELNKPLSIEDVDVAEPGPDEVLVKTKACGVCHSDLHTVHGGIAAPLPTARPQLIGGRHGPGHGRRFFQGARSSLFGAWAARCSHLLRIATSTGATLHGRRSTCCAFCPRWHRTP